MPYSHVMIFSAEIKDTQLTKEKGTFSLKRT